MPRSRVLLVALILCGDADAADRSIIGSDLDRISLGASFLDIDNAKEMWQARKLKSPAADGVVVMDVIPNGPLAAAGLRSMDVITVFSKQKVKSAKHFVELIDELKSGDEVTVTGYRLIAGAKAFSWKFGTVKVKPEPAKASVLKAMKESRDEVGGTITVREDTAPPLSERQDDAQMRFVIEDGNVGSAALMVQYVHPDNLFMSGVQIRAGETLLELPAGRTQSDVFRRGNDLVSYEATAIPINWDTAQKLREIWKSKKATLRIVGSNHHVDRELTREEKTRLKLTAYAFELRGGTWPEK